MNPVIKKFLIGSALIVILGLAYLYKTQMAEDVLVEMEAIPSETDNETVTSGIADTTAVHAETILVHVTGAVMASGVYNLPAGSRVSDALVAAGGVSENGAGDYLNLAQILEDGQKIVVPAEGDVENIFGTVTAVPETSDGKININEASLSELMTLSGIGEVRAQAIIDYRNANGGFTSIEEIMNVDGIKEAAFQKIKDKIVI